MSRSAAETEWYERFRHLALAEVRPSVRRHDDEHALNRPAWGVVGAADLFRLPVRPELGGLGLGLRAFAAALEGLADGSGDLGFSVSAVAHAVCALVVQEFGSPEQHRLYLPRLLSGEWVGAVANAEAQAGTNLMAITSRATATAGGFELTAEKQCITNVGVADLALVSARLADAPARKEVNVFLVETAGPGVEQTTLVNLEGLRTSCTGDLRVRQAPLLGHAVLGGVGAGLGVFRSMFALERLLTGVLYLAALRACLDRAVHHAETRQQFGRPVGRNQHVQERVIRMRVGEHLLWCLLDDLFDAVERGLEVGDRLSLVKVHGIEAALDASAGLMRLLGGRGMTREERAEKYHRDLLALSVLGGTVELHKLVVYQELARRVAAAPAPPAGLTVTVHDVRELPPALEQALVELTARLFPDEPALRGRYYFDTRPDLVVVGWKDATLAGFRIVTRRSVDLAPGALRMAGLGIGVDPRFQRQGVGRELTRRTLEVLRELGDDLALAFLFTPAAEPLLRSFGFRRLRARVTYLLRESGELVAESMPAYALDLGQGTLVDEIDARGALHLGTGTW
jgi:alkylation response protein AidB-like acyl-CoA dehydrogenase/GNAT superfamily N-acetyltransferase